MFKKILLFSVAAVWMFVAANIPSSYAKSPSQINVTLPEFPVTLNGTMVDNKHSMYPLLLYKDITYFPMTFHYTTSLGLILAWNATDGLSIHKQNSSLPLQQDLNSDAAQGNSYSATLVPFPVSVNGHSIANEQEEYPLLFYRDIVYFPMTWRFTHDTFGWTTDWKPDRGLQIQAIETDPVIKAKQTAALNLVNGGQLAVQGDWIYMNPSNKYSGANNLIKIKSDGSGKQTLSDDNAMSINVTGDWLYYASWDNSTSTYHGIIRIKTDGTERSVVASVPTTRIWVHDGWIYYVQRVKYTLDTGGPAEKVTGIHKMRLDGSEDTIVAEGEGSFNFYIDGDDLYFLKQEKPYVPDSLFKIKTDGSGLKKLQEEVLQTPVVIDGWVYYHKDKVMHKTDREGLVDIELYTSDQWMGSFHYHEGWIYFIKGSFGFMGSASIEKIRVDGTGHTALTSARATSLYLAGTELYYPQAFMGDNTLKSIRIP